MADTHELYYRCQLCKRLEKSPPLDIPIERIESELRDQPSFAGIPFRSFAPLYFHDCEPGVRGVMYLVGVIETQEPTDE